MRQSELYRSIAEATGETISTIKRLGFLIADPTQPITDPESEFLGPHVIDWDDLHVQRNDPTELECMWS